MNGHSNTDMFLFENLGFAILILNSTGNILDVNTAATGLFGLTKTEFLKLHGRDLEKWSVLNMKEGSQSGIFKLCKQSIAQITSFENIQMKLLPDNHTEPLRVNLSIYPTQQNSSPEEAKAIVIIQDRSADYQSIAELKQFKKAVDNSTNAVGMSTPEGKHYYQNRAFDQLFGEIGPDPPSSLYVDEKTGREVFQTIMAGDEWTGEVEMYAKDRSVLTIQLRAYAVKSSKAQVIGLVGVHTDITATKHAESKLKLSEERLKLALEGAHADSWDMNLQTGDLIYSDEWANYLGYKKGEIPKTITSITTLIHPDDYPNNMQRLEAHLKGKSDIYETETRLRKKNGEYLWLLSRGRIVEWDKKHKPIRLVGVNFDITELKLAREKIWESEEKFRQLAEESPNMIFINQNGKIVYANKICQEQTGYSLKELYHPGFNFYTLIDKDYHALVKEKYHNHLKGNEVEPYEYVLITKRGIKRNVIINTKLINFKQSKAILGIITDVTEFKLIEQSLQINEKRLQKNVAELEAIINALPGMVSVVDRDFNVLVANEEVVQTFGHDSTNDVLGRKCYQTRKGLKHPCPQCGLAEAFRTGRTITRTSTPEEEIQMGVSTKAYAVPLRTRDGEIWGGVEVIMDISDLRQAEKAIQESEKKFRHMIENGGECITLIDAQGKVLYESSTVKTTTGYSPEERLGQNSLDTIYEEDKPGIIKILSAIVKSPGESQSAQFRAIRKGGAIWWVNATVTNMLSDPSVEALVVNYRDITAQKEAEEKLKITQFGIDHSQIGVFQLDDHAGIQYANKYACTSLGYSLDELRNIKVSDFDNNFNSTNWNALKMAAPSKGSRTIETHYKRKDGSIFPVELTLNHIEFHGKSLTFIFANDISDRKKAEDEIRKKVLEYQELNEQYLLQNKKLSNTLNRIQNINNELKKAKLKSEESDKLKTAFLANMSHEIRTPMNGILGFTDLLKAENLTKEEKGKYINIIQQSGNRMLHIINDLIDISKIEAGQVELDLGPCQLNKLIDNFEIFFYPEAEKKNVQIITSKGLEDSTCTVISDETKLEQVISNLIKNALKYTSEGSIRFGYKLEDQMLKFVVEDSGTGIHPESLSVIFDRFRQGKQQGNKTVEGSGLGLSISKAYIEMLGGKIWVESELNKGSKFTFTHPYQIAKEPIPDVNLVKEEKMVGHSQKILIAEDDASSKLYLEEVLKSMNATLIHASDGLEAVNIVSENPDIALVLMDIKMPLLNGLDATRQIKKIRPTLPVIAQTAFASAQDNQNALIAGCDDYISKPIHKKLLLELIKKYM